jgi:hypothetical protein
MTRPTEATCPVCAEPLGERPEQCFRCETALGRWWEFEDALGALDASPAPMAGASWARMLPVVFVGAALGAAGTIAVRRAPPPPVTAALPPAPIQTPRPAESPSRSAVLTYRVQRGDSLWRIASAITGDGRRWRELWPEHQGGEGRIAAGTVLRLDLSRLGPEER